MLSSDLEHIYWMSRHVERAENVARFIDGNHHFGLDLPPGMPRWGPLLLTVADDPQLFVQRYGKPNRENIIRFLSFDPENSSSILSCWRAAHENARSARNVISQAMREELNEFCLFVERAAAKQGKRDRGDNFRRQVMRASHLLEGTANATLTQDEGWHFARLGRLLERAEMTTRMFHVMHLMAQAFSANKAGFVGPLHWKAVLQSAGAFEMYRRQYGKVKPDRATDFLILDLQFPRSVRSCMRQANESLHALTGTPARTFQNLAEQRLGRLVALLDYADIEEIDMQDLHEFLTGLQTKLGELKDSISDVCSHEAPTAGGIRE